MFAFPLPGGLEIYDPLRSGSPTTTGQFSSVGTLISALLPYSFITGGLILFVMLLMGGFEILTSMGSDEKTKGGYDRIKNALLGFVLLFAIFWMAQIAQILFKLPIL